MADSFNAKVWLRFPADSDQWIVFGEMINAVQRTFGIDRFPRSWVVRVQASTSDDRSVSGRSLADVKAGFERHRMKAEHMTFAIIPAGKSARGIHGALLGTYFPGDEASKEYKKGDFDVSSGDRILLESFIADLQADFSKALLRLAPGTIVSVAEATSQSRMTVRGRNSKGSRDWSGFTDWMKDSSSKIFVFVVGAILVAVILAVLKGFGIILS